MANEFDDTFAGVNNAPPDPLKWTKLVGSPDIQANKLEFTALGEVNETVRSNAKITGDFDVQVDFEKTAGAAASAWGIDMEAYIDDTHGVLVRYQYGPAAYYWTQGYENGAGGWTYDTAAATSATTGKIRITRSGSTLHTYYWNGASWTEISTGRACGSGTVYIIIRAVHSDTAPTMTWRASNFLINSGTTVSLLNPLLQPLTQITMATYADPQPTNLITGTEAFAANTGQFTQYTEGTPGTFTVDGQGKLIHNSGAARNTIETVTAAALVMPQFFVSIDVVSTPTMSATYHNFGPGFVKDANNFIFCSVDRQAQFIRVQIKIGGTNTWACTLTSQAWVCSEPYKLGLSLVGSSACIWKDVGAGWVYVGGADIAAYYNFRTADLSLWKAGFCLATANNGTTYFDNLKWGRFGGIGMRDHVAVTLENGLIYQDGSYMYFSASCPDPRASSSCGIFKMNMTTHTFEQVAALAISRNSGIWLDLNAHIIRYAANTYKIVFTTWDNGFGGSIRVQYKAEASLNLLSGSNVLSGASALSLPNIDSSSYGSYDPMLYYNVNLSRWEIVYAITEDTSFPSDKTFWAAAAYSADLASWTAIAEDLGFRYEGTKMLRYLETYYLMAGGQMELEATALVSQPRLFDTNMTFLGRIPLTTTATSPVSHPMMFKFGTKLYLLSFDATRVGSVVFTEGQPLLYYIEVEGGAPSDIRQDRLDISGNDRHLADTGVAATGDVPGKIGNAVYFSGADEQLLTRTSAPDLTSNAHFTASFRMKVHCGAPPGTDIYWHWTIGTLVMHAGIKSGQTNGFVSAATPSLTCDSGNTLSQDAWYLVTIYFNGSGLYIDIDDVNVDEDVGASTGIASAATAIEMGFSAGVSMNIKIDEVGLWVGANALSPSERSILYHGNYGQRPVFI